MRSNNQFRIAIILIFGLIALGLLTWGMGRVYLELVSYSGHGKVQGVQTGKADNNTGSDNVLILPEAKFWTCQVGVFESESHAQVRKEQLMVLGLKAEIISSNPWTISIGLGHSADDLQGLRQNLSEKGITTIPKQIVLPKRTYRVTGNGSQLTKELLTNVNDILREGLTTNALAKEQQIWDSLAGGQPLKQLEGLHQVYCQVLEKTSLEDQNTLGLSLFFESQRVINLLSGK